MRLNRAARLAVAIVSCFEVVAFHGTSHGQAVDAGCRECDVAIARALRLLPEQPARVIVVEKVPATVRAGAEGFVVAGQDAVYLARFGPTLQLALPRAGIADYALAAIVWHEMAHLRGASEREAQRAEEDLWAQFIRQGRVDQTRGRRYMALLQKRHP